MFSNLRLLGFLLILGFVSVFGISGCTTAQRQDVEAENQEQIIQKAIITKTTIFRNKEMLVGKLKEIAIVIQPLSKNEHFTKFVAKYIETNQIQGNLRSDLLTVLENYENTYGENPWKELGLSKPDYQMFSICKVDDVSLRTNIALPFLDKSGEMENENWDHHSVEFTAVGQFVHPDHIFCSTFEGTSEISKPETYRRSGWYIGYTYPAEIFSLSPPEYAGLENVSSDGCSCFSCPNGQIMCQGSATERSCKCSTGNPCPTGNCYP